MFCYYVGVHCCEVGVYVLFFNGVWVSANVSCVVIECGLFLESGSVFVYY